LKILVIGGGAREHTLVWKLLQSPKVSEVYAAPGNAGTAKVAHNININPSDMEGLAQAAKKERIDLVVVGPEAPLAEGIVDYFENKDIPVFGPTKAAAQIEASKVFAKDLAQKYGIPCAKSKSFSDYAEAKEYLKKQNPPLVVKADGLAAGKGVSVAKSVPEALDALKNIMQNRAFGAAGDKVVIEEYLEGSEMSSFAFTDGQAVIPMVAACDYKPVYDGNKGPNTGGMGSFSPPHFYSPELDRIVMQNILKPAVEAMDKEGKPYQGVLYGGLMITPQSPKVLEFNARFGDPETQVVLPRLKTDLVEILMAVVNGKLDQIEVKWDDNACVGVVMASAGYPGSYKTGFPIRGLDSLDKEILVFHAGTKTGSNQGEVVTSGGRVLTVAATGKTLGEAKEKVYANIPKIQFEGCHYRKDIAKVKEN